MWPARSADQWASDPGAPDGSELPVPRSADESGVAAAQGGVLTSPAIYTVDLRKQYRHTVAVDALSMTVRRGEMFGFLGPNGAGKTTAVKLLLGLVHPTGGEAMVFGAPQATSRRGAGSATCQSCSASRDGCRREKSLSSTAGS